MGGVLSHVQTAFVYFDGERLPGRVADDGRMLTIAMPLLKNGTYEAHLFNDAGHTDANPRQNRVAVIPDAPPTESPKEVLVDQVGCRYVPHVVAVEQGASVRFRNSDPTLHCSKGSLNALSGI